MDTTTPTLRDIRPAQGDWLARHDASRADGPFELCDGQGEPWLRDVTFYVDDLGADLALSERFRVACKGGVATVETTGRYPFGAGISVKQALRYAVNHVRVVTDVQFPPGSIVRRHLGLGGFTLPGRWRRFYCLPPALHLAEGRQGGWQDIPAEAPASGMIGHWHRPPLRLVFERDDGVRVEVGTGGDVWRWEQNFGFGPEAGNYKLRLEPGGLRLEREPLMTCAEVSPVARIYRLTWYLAWEGPKGRRGDAAAAAVPEAVPVSFSARGEAMVRAAAGTAASPALRLDLRDWPAPPQARRAATPGDVAGERRDGGLCWESVAVQKAFRRIIRQVAALGPEGTLVLCGLEPGLCWDPAHCQRRGAPQAHWDMDALLAVSVWTRQQLGLGWRIVVERGAVDTLPAESRLFEPTGFAAAGGEVADD
ncbi:MAG: hypothetical protein GX595_17965 [Lentisphaerae bacterium]|nr:hypothetical protein [Lentisphaerota bacterium]